MNADIVNVLKILVLFTLVAARYHDRIRDFKFGDMKVPKPKKERMKKAMKFIKRTWRFWIESKSHLCFYVSFTHTLVSEAYDRLCHLGQMFNDRMSDVTLQLNMEGGSLHLFSSIPMDYAQVRPEIVDHRLYNLTSYATDISWAFDKLLKTDEEAVFVFAELVERNNAK
jgi:hypothetical protein